MNLMKNLTALLIVLGATAAFPALAQTDDNDDIVVVGERQVTVRELRRQASDITPREGYAGEPLPRMHQEICAGVWGMSPESAQLVIDRIYYNAEMIGLPVIRETDCRPNIIVAVTPDPDAEFAAMRNESHMLVRGLDLWDRKRVDREEDYPVLAYNVVVPFLNDPDLPLSRGQGVETTMMSRTMTSTGNAIAFSLIMVAKDAVDGMDGVALADYATMRAFVRTREPGNGTTVGTILSVFDDPDNAPLRLTAFDRAYLAGVYDSRQNRPMHRSMGLIGTRLRQALATEE